MIESFQNTLPQVIHGHHCCLLFSSSAEQIKITAPYIGLGLERDERCVHVGDPETIEQVRQALKDGGIAVEKEIQKKRLFLASERDYLDAGRFNTEKMLSFLQQTYDSAMADGFTGLRASGDISWEVGPEQNFSEIVYYETLLDVFFLGKRMVGMCQYPKYKCPPEVLSGILNTHRVAAMDGEIYPDNIHYVPPELLLEKDPKVRQDKRVEWMTSQLFRLKKAEESQEQAFKQLLQEKMALERVNMELDNFVYIASHDLKTPLRALVSFSGILNAEYKDKLDQKGREYADEIGKGARRLYALIEDLLTLSRVSRLNNPFKNVSSEDLVRAALTRLEYAKTDKVKISVPADMPLICCDSIKMKEVFVNLLSNAIKFSSKQPVSIVEVGFADLPEEWQFSVKDNGIGIDPKYHEHVFEMFKKLNSADEFEGTGVGLYIVRKIIDYHKGRVWVESDLGKGTTLRFQIPKVPAVEPDSKPA